ncbi:MAG: acyl-CoA oxidase [Myxococcales bacterium]|nr:acyl-CoA oxidase [Myxococcales bacterium]
MPLSTDWPEDRPELLPFLPLVYAAWADGVLTARELEAIRGRISAQDWLEEGARDALSSWLDPARPPSPSALVGLRERLRSVSGGVAGETHRTLVELGLDLARAEGAQDTWTTPEARRALEELERELGVVPEEAVRRVLADAVAPRPAEAPASEAPLSGALAELATYLQRPRSEVRRRVLELLATDAFAFAPDVPRAEHRTRVLEAVRALADAGLGSLGYPKELGGGGDPGAGLAAFETLAFGDSSVLVKYGVQFGLFGGSILNLGTAAHHRRYLKDVGTLALPGCYAMTESGHGSNVRDLETTARYDHGAGQIIVDTPHDGARKDWIGNAALHARMATVFARLIVAGEDHGVHAVLVPIRDADGNPLPGIEIEDRGAKVGLEGVDNGLIRFRAVRVPRENLLDRFARVDEQGRYVSPIPSADRRFFTMLGTLVAGRISIAAASVSAAKVGLTIAVRWSARRRQFGPGGGAEVPLLHYLAHQRRLLVPLAATYGLHFAVRALSERYADRLHGEHGGQAAPSALPDTAEGGEAPAPGDEEGRRIEVEAAGLKAYASRHCVEALQACREACGGQGYLAANRLGRLRADTDVFTTFEGANAVLLQLVAKGLLSQYKEEMSDLRLWGLVKHLAERAETHLTEMNPVSVRRTDSEHLRDPDFHGAAFEYREERLLASAGRRLRALIGDGVDSFDAMNRVQDHLMALAEAHVERSIHEAFQDGIARAPSPAASESIASLARLWALARLEADRGWFLESGYFEVAKARALRSEVNALCAEVAKQAPALVDAFGIPDEVLRAPAGRRD